ncbi:hypothetical protein Q8F55_006520 [Vanrija albida]|uniref:Myb-like domain-containing protein n=1 Tax=Vanrija albida TaxID=181172 RepID=A0ABR3PXE1_9TREE
MPPARTPRSSPAKPYAPKPALRTSDSAPAALAPSPKRWTRAEYVALFDHVAVHGAVGFEHAVPGRSEAQCRRAFVETVAPLCRAALAAKGKDE